MTDSKHGFQKKSSVIIHENPYFRINKHDIIQPDGTPGTYWVIEREDFAICVPLFADNTTLLVGQYRYPAHVYSWEFAMGHVVGQEGVAIAKQELLEETGYTAAIWEEIGAFYPAPGLTNEKAMIYVAKELKEEESAPEAEEFLTTKRVSIEELAKMIETGTIKDGPTIIAYHFLERYLKKNTI